MEKRGQMKSVVVVFLLIIILGFAGFFLYNVIVDIAGEEIEFVRMKENNENSVSFSSSSQFYPNMRFSSKRISFYINDECSEDKKEKMRDAFSTLEEKTGLLKFSEKEADADIGVDCEESGEPVPGEFFIAGEGGPTKIINTSLFYIIEEGKVLLLYSKSKCENNNVELHELLHVFGFKHSENEDSIMHNTTSCSQILTNDIVDELKRLYSIDELADLKINDVSASKKGKYLDFRIVIGNQGLADSGNVNLELYVDENKKVDSFEIGVISYMENKILEASNIKLPSRDTEKIKFVIVDSKVELDKTNNEVELVLS